MGEPPRLAQLAVRPQRIAVKIGDQASFTCFGLDQYGQPLDPGAVQWSATGGSIDAKGLLTTGDHGGAFSVKARAGGFDAFAEVRIVTKDGIAMPVPPPPGKQTISGRGTVPTTKWMNFYTKIISRFAANPELTIEVSFAVPVEREQAKAKADETKAGLKELGLGGEAMSNWPPCFPAYCRSVQMRNYPFRPGQTSGGWHSFSQS